MTYNIKSPAEYQQVMDKIETYLQQATKSGGFHTLTPEERQDLEQLSRIAEVWEDNIPLMPTHPQ